MKVGMISRFCDTCQKDVYDLRHMNREQLVAFLLRKRGNSICGRVHPSQLDYSHTEVVATLQGIVRQKRHSNLAFYLLAIGAISLVGCTTEIQSETNAVEAFKVETLAPDTLAKADTTSPLEQVKDTVLKAKDTLVAPPPVPLEGLVVINDSTEITQEGMIEFTEGEIELIEHLDMIEDSVEYVYEIAQKMPEFPGGMDSLFQFINTHLQYPEPELNNGIQGKVFVEFIVHEDGHLSDTKILRSVPGSTHFDAEVLKLIEIMPPWIPGEEDGKKVKVKFRLPIRFVIPN